MDVVELPRGDSPCRLFMDRHVYESDGAILINRIKPHTDFHGRYESGLMKMALIGLGKLEGARAVHDFGSTDCGSSSNQVRTASLRPGKFWRASAWSKMPSTRRCGSTC